jgi:exodeoxyribonuclease III
VKIAMWNINGVNGRLDLLLAWLRESKPDVVCLQELKAPQSGFPQSAIDAAGYGAIWRAESRWNGVHVSGPWPRPSSPSSSANASSKPWQRNVQPPAHTRKS